jgi:ribosomal-protein-alanine N-acetyltransferase|tara:strand:+ start:381 stop:797 length:417 start_codon:yes stop_codon:yes gene_type:complete
MIPEVKYPCKLSIAKNILNDLIEENKRDGKENFIIDIDKQAVGAIGLTKIIKGHKAEIWSWLGEKYRRKEIITKAHKLISDYAFKKYKLKRIYGNLLTKNIGSAKMLEKSGFKKEALLKKNAKINGKFYDEFIYAKLK